jgi:hypothetical protein
MRTVRKWIFPLPFQIGLTKRNDYAPGSFRGRPVPAPFPLGLRPHLQHPWTMDDPTGSLETSTWLMVHDAESLEHSPAMAHGPWDVRELPGGERWRGQGL